MPDYTRSVDDMVADMEKAVTEPEGNTSNAKHRQHVAEAIKQLIDSQIISKKVRYIGAQENRSWQFHKHIAGTTYHKVSFTEKVNKKQINSWIKFWEHITNKKRPQYCPGRANGCTHEAHSFGDKPNACVGAHVILKREKKRKNEQGDLLRFARFV